MNEILAGIKVLKLYAWELPFMKRIKEIRSKEIKFLKVNAWIYGIVNFTFRMSPFLVTIGSFRYNKLEVFHYLSLKFTNFISVFMF